MLQHERIGEEMRNYKRSIHGILPELDVGQFRVSGLQKGSGRFQDCHMISYRYFDQIMFTLLFHFSISIIYIKLMDAIVGWICIILLNSNIHMAKHIFLILLVCSIALPSLQVTIAGQQINDQLKALLGDIDRTIQIGKANIWKQIQQNQPLWNFPPWLGTFFLSEYYFQLKVLNITKDFTYPTKFDVEFFKEKLIKEQEEDGSWMQLIDLNRKQGNLDATIFNYWFLKDVGVSIDSETMKKAQKFILGHGGIENAQVMTKYKLAAFGVYEWAYLPYVPLSLFYKSSFPFYSYGYIKDYIGQWVYPHLTGLAYLRYHKTVFPVSRVCLQELRTSRSDYCQQFQNKNSSILQRFSKTEKDPYVDNLMEQIIQLRGPKGAFGAYTISTLLNLMSFKDYTLRYGNDNEIADYYSKNIYQSISFIEEMYFNKRVPYEGSLDDGRYWDTILALFGLLEAGQKPEKTKESVEYLIKTAVQPNGGIPYGWQFEYAPDIDDTAMLLMIYGKMKTAYPGQTSFGSYQNQMNRTYSWLKSNQNGDGGFPAFDKDKNDDQYKAIKLIFKLTRIDKSAQIFDPSCPDIVGHMLESMGESSIFDEEVIKKSVQYLYKNRKDGMWSGRWGINYVYAVGAVYPGLARVGYDLNSQWILNVTKRLQEVQQQDGGFGEDSESYNIDKYLKGVTTASMTAWGLLAYIDAAYTNTPHLQANIIKAAKYLLNNFKENNNKFFDRSVVGAGHRGLLNLQYPVYAYSFPLVALSRLSKLIKGQYKHYVNKEMSAKIEKHLKISNQQNNDL